MSDKRCYLSGSQKRKKKNQTVENVAKLSKIDSFFKNPASELNIDCIASTSRSVSLIEIRSTQEVKDSSKECETDVNNDVDRCVIENSTVAKISYKNKSQNDIGFFPMPLSKEAREKILAGEPCRPLGPFPKDIISKRSFSAEYYSYATITGQKIERYWLCYSPKLDAVYCEPCWLFNEFPESRSWRIGIRDWQGLSKKIKKHESSKSHLHAFMTYGMWKKNKTIVDQLSEEHRKWKEIFTRIIDVVRTLAMCSLPFRGHRENTESIGSESGNFLNIVDLLSRYDSLLRAHLSNEKSRNKYLHHEIQNDMISILACSVMKTLLFRITSAPYYSLILDTTQDISKRDQLSIVIRYTTLTEKNPGENSLQIHESFLGFEEVGDQTSETFENSILLYLKEKGIDIQKCRGQGYDGASNMSGQYTGLQKRIKNIVPTAEYVHCAAHNLNLVLNDSVFNITEVSQFYDIVQQTYVFFSVSLPRWQALNKTLEGELARKKIIKKLCPTRWASRNDCLLALKQNFQCVMKCLTKIILSSHNKQEVEQALVIRKHLDSFQFILMITLQNKILENISRASESVQSKSVDLHKACIFLSHASEKLQHLRRNFSEFFLEAKQLALTWNISCELKQKRRRTVKRYFDEIASDYRIDNPLKAFEINIFNTSLDIAINQIKNRFVSLRTVAENFSFLEPKSLIKLTEKEISEKVNILISKYPSDITCNLISEVLLFRNLLGKEIDTKRNIRDIARLLIEENSFLLSSFPELIATIQLYFTLPVTTATAERSFSKLKLIKNYLRSTMSQSRLSDLAILSIEHEETRAINIDQAVNKFLLKKKRRLGKI